MYVAAIFSGAGKQGMAAGTTCGIQPQQGRWTHQGTVQVQDQDNGNKLWTSQVQVTY